MKKRPRHLTAPTTGSRNALGVSQAIPVLVHAHPFDDIGSRRLRTGDTHFGWHTTTGSGSIHARRCRTTYTLGLAARSDRIRLAADYNASETALRATRRPIRCYTTCMQPFSGTEKRYFRLSRGRKGFGIGPRPRSLVDRIARRFGGGPSCARASKASLRKRNVWSTRTAILEPTLAEQKFQLLKADRQGRSLSKATRCWFGVHMLRPFTYSGHLQG